MVDERGIHSGVPGVVVIGLVDQDKGGSGQFAQKRFQILARGERCGGIVGADYRRADDERRAKGAIFSGNGFSQWAGQGGAAGGIVGCESRSGIAGGDGGSAERFIEASGAGEGDCEFDSGCISLHRD